MTLVHADGFTQIYDESVSAEESWYVNDHTIFCDGDGTWHLIGITDVEPAVPFNASVLAHATAPSLHGPWTRHPFAASVEPALGETVLWAPHVIEHDGRFWMFVCAGGDDHSAWGIHLLISDDGWTWERHAANPLIVDGYQARDPMVLRVGDRWVMYYTATSDPAGGNHVVAAAESTDLVHWEGRHLVYVDEMSGTDAGPTESPFVVGRDGQWYLFVGPHRMRELHEGGGTWDIARWREIYSSTVVLESDDPLSFDIADKVGTIAAHAPEVITDDDGSTWITHCGWGEGGVYLAPLVWE